METFDRASSEGLRPGRRWVSVLLGGGLIASISSFLYPIIQYVLPPLVAESTNRSVTAAKVGELKNNSAKIFKFGSQPAILIRASDGEYRAFTAVCTHLSCTVQYRADLHQVWCPCHDGIYDLSGRNVSGPPPRPLETYEVHVQGDDIVVTRSA